MKKFQDLVAKEKEKWKSKQKLSFKGLGSTMDLNQATKPKKIKSNYPSFRALAAQNNQNSRQQQNRLQNIEFTLKKQQINKRQEMQKIEVNNFNSEQFQFIPKNKQKPASHLEGISMIDSVVIDEDDKEYDHKNPYEQQLNTKQKNQVQLQLNKVTLDLKKKLFNQSKTINSFRDAMKQVIPLIQIETQRSYSKILQQRAVFRGRSISSPQKSNQNNPSSNSFLSIVSKRSPLIKLKSNQTSPLQFESPQTSANTKPRKQKSTSQNIRHRIVGNNDIKVTEFKFQ